jgi:hypothetical protein
MKWGEASERPFIQISQGINNDYDSYNASLADVDAQEKDVNSMLNFYKEICAIKGRSDFPKNGTYKGYEWSGSQSILHYTISGNGTTFKFYIHTAGSDTNNVSISLNNEEVIYKYNATETTLKPYSLVVTKVK